jgi:hypothetical protein
MSREDLESKCRPGLESRLEGGEELRGLCVASQQKSMFKGGAAVIGVTDRRVLILSLDRKGDPVGEPLSLTPDRIESAKAGPAGGGWANVDAAVLDHAAVRLQIRTTEGQLKLMLMRGEGKVLGKLGGGEPQRRGVQALGQWFQNLEGS